MTHLIKYFLLINLAAILISCGNNKSNDDDEPETSAQEKVLEVLRALESGDSTAVTDYISETTYIQHNLGFADGRAALAGAIDAGALTGTTVDVRRIFQDGNFVVTHNKYFLFGEEQVGIDVFRLNDSGLIVEHWDNLQAADGDSTATASGNSMLDGVTEVSDTHLTATNKALVQDFVEDVLVGGDTSTFASYFNTDPGDGSSYIQHNPLFMNGQGELLGCLQSLEAMTPSKSLFTELHMVIGQGNFVLTMSEGNDANCDGTPETNRTAYFDIFRVEDGKIVEHWDTVQAIPAEADWANTNGKFYEQELYESKVVEVLEALEVTPGGPYTDNIMTWELNVDPDYIQHNQFLATGRDAVTEAMTAMELDGTTVDVRRTFNDGNIVVTHTDYFIFGSDQVGFDVFRFEDGLIVEHWDNLQIRDGDSTNTANPNTMLDGFTNIKDKDQTEANKLLVTSFVEDVLVNGDTANYGSYFEGDGSGYIQHNPGFMNGASSLEGFIDGFGALYTSLEYVYGEGNFVLTMSEGLDALGLGGGDGNPDAYFDLFRVEDGKIVEHWDVIQTLSSTPANMNGKW